jgi:transposase
MISSQELRELKNRNLKRYKIIVWDQDGMSIHSIAKSLDMNRKDVRTILDRFNEYGSVEYDLRSVNKGKPLMLTESKLRVVEKIILENEPMNLEGIKEQIKEEMDLEVSRSTLSRALKNIGSFQIPTWTPFLTTQHKIDRLNYCKTHLEQKSTFRDVIFTDESRFYMNRNTKKVFVVTGQQGVHKQKFNPDYSIMVWGAICYEGTLHLQIVEGRMNHEDYIDILERCFNDALPSLKPRKKW